MSALHYFARNSVIRIASFAVGVGFTLVVTPVVVGAMGKAQYGVWVLVSSVGAYFLLLEGGVMQAVSRFAAAAIARGDGEEVDRVFTAGVALHGLACVAGLLATVLVVACTGLFDVQHVSPGRLRQSLFIYCSCLGVMFLFKTYTGILMAEMRWTFIALLAMLRSIVTSLAVLFTIDESNGLVLLSAVNGSGFLLESLLAVLAVRLRGSAHLRPRLFDRQLARQLLGYGWSFTVSLIGESMRYRPQHYIIAFFLGVREVAVFAIAMQFVNYFQSLMLSAFGIMVPYFSRMQASGDGQGTRETLLYSLRLSHVFSSVIALCLIFYGRDFILLWLGDGFAASYDALVPMSIGAALSLGMMPSDGYLLGTAAHRMLARCTVAEGVGMTVLALLLVRPFGLAGVAWAFLVASVVFRAGLVPWLVFGHAGLSYAAYGRLLAGLAVTHVLPQAGCHLLIRGSLGTGYWQLAVYGMAQVCLALLTEAAVMRWHGRRQPAPSPEGGAA